MSNYQELSDKICPRCGTKATFVADSYIKLPSVWNGANTRHLINSPECFKLQMSKLKSKVERLQACLMLAQEVGEDWRGDWSDFDGRTLRNQMNELDKVADGTMTVDEYRQSNLSSEWGK